MEKYQIRFRNGNLYFLNLSHNLLVSLQELYSIFTICLLDLHSNQLRRNIRYMSPKTSYVNYSNNNSHWIHLGI
ncbi:hypothetical protein CUMW_254830, partial [Citrus unshiu]